MSVNFVQVITGGGNWYLPFLHESHQWEIRGGYVGPVQPWLCPTDVAQAIAASLSGLAAPENEVSLTMGEPNNPTTVDRVVFLGLMPSDDPQNMYLLFTDVRWYLTHAIFVADVNLRRRVGDTRLIENSLVDTAVVDTQAYCSWTVDGLTLGPDGKGTAYTWASQRDKVMNSLVAEQNGRPALDWELDAFSILTVPAQTLEGMSTDSDGTLGMARAIESIPGAGVYVDLNGILHVYERTLGAEDVLIQQLPPALEGHGCVQYIDHSPIRPIASAASYRVYFDYELEVRLTYNFTGSGLWSTVGINDPFLRPVLQVTDLSLSIPAGYWGPSREVGQGSWITQDEAFAAWGPTTVGTIDLPQLTDDIVAHHWLGDGLQAYYMGTALVTNDPIWAARIQELMRCYRNYFRVNPNFWERVRHAWAVRAAIWDPTTGSRGPAPVYSNFCLIPYGPFSSYQIMAQGGGINHLDSYPETGLLADGQPSGFRCEIEDEELGIIVIDRAVLNKFKGHTDIIPSPIKVLPSINEEGDRYGFPMEIQAGNLISATTGDGGGTPSAPNDGWKLAVIISVAPASPNDKRRLYEVQVSPEDAATYIGLPDSVTTDGNGPQKEMRNHRGQARVAWQDDTGVYDNILAVLGCGDTADTISNQDPITALRPVNFYQEIQPMAWALVGADLMNKLDCWEGEQAVPQNDALVPLGSILSVTHKVMDDMWVSSIKCERSGPQWNAEDFLKGTSRNYLLKQIASER